MLQSICYRRLAAASVGPALCLVAHTAAALSGTINLASCACSSTADFQAAAKQQAHLFDSNGGGNPAGNYIVASTSGARSAYIAIAGSYQIKNKEIGPVWVTSSATPIDSNGNSMASQSEANLQSFYSSFDAITMSTSRNMPARINEPPDYAGSFINSDESEVVPGIGKAFILLGINPSFFDLGSVITVVFEDGSTAQYTKVSKTGSYQWSWNGIAHDKNGKKINRSGAVIAGGGTGGGGSFDVKGFGTGTGGGFNWDWAGDGVRGQITVGEPIGSAYSGGTGSVQFSYY